MKKNEGKRIMNSMKSGQLIALVIGMIILAVFGFNIMRVHAHGHGGEGQGSGGHGGHHHGEHPHEHHRGGEHQHEGSGGYYSHYHHSHGDHDDHSHDCRPIKESGSPTGTDPFNEECMNHNNEWEPNSGG